MIRIMTAEEQASTMITVDGKLSGDSIAPVEACCAEALSQGKPVRLYLRDISAIDERGRTMLRYLAARGVDLSADGIYSAYVVHQIRSEGAWAGGAVKGAPRARQGKRI